VLVHSQSVGQGVEPRPAVGIQTDFRMSSLAPWDVYAHVARNPASPSGCGGIWSLNPNLTPFSQDDDYETRNTARTVTEKLVNSVSMSQTMSCLVGENGPSLKVISQFIGGQTEIPT
jgi:hypothetical protein